jgi:hypothetical protein
MYVFKNLLLLFVSASMYLLGIIRKWHMYVPIPRFDLCNVHFLCLCTREIKALAAKNILDQKKVTYTMCIICFVNLFMTQGKIERKRNDSIFWRREICMYICMYICEMAEMKLATK